MRSNIFRAAGLGALALALFACSDQQGLLEPSRPSALGIAATGPVVVINEIMPNPAAVLDSEGEWFEVHNAGDAPVDLQGWQIASANDAVHTVGASVVVPAGGYAVFARNADSTTNGGVTAAYSYASGATTMNLNNSTTDWLALRDPSGAGVDSVAWGTSSPPNGSSRGVIDALVDNSVMSSAAWATQTTVYGRGDKGTPGAANDGAGITPPPPPPPSTGDVVINEVLGDPNAVLDANGEWFEVHNRGTAAVNLQGWTIASNNDAAHTISASVVIAAGGYAVFARNADSTTNGDVRPAYSYAVGGVALNLSNTADYVALRNGSGVTVDSVAWAVAPPRGASRALTDPASDNLDVGGTAWFTSTQTFGAGDKGTPGAANSTVVDPGQPGVPATISISINFPQQAPVGYTKPAFPTVRDGLGATISPLPALAWTSSDPTVATVDSLGYIRALSVGTVSIRATASNGVFGQVSFTVIPADAFTPAIYRNHLEFGAPVDGTPDDEHVLQKRQFVTSWNAARGGPNWVSWNVNATQFGAAPRCDCFSTDLALPASFPLVVDFNYRNGGYDRGHMVQSESRTTTDQENASTFLLTNILPQAGENNQGPWSRFENYLNDLARQQGKEIYVIAGGQYAASAPTLKNEGVVAVPDYTWKVAVVMDGGEGVDDVNSTDDVRVIAIKMPNLTTPGVPASAVGIRNNPWEMYETTVDAIEAAVGYDLLAALPDRVERIVESGDRAPVAATDGPYTGFEGAAVTLDASASSDPDGDALEYAWDFGDGTTGAGVRPSHTYADNGNYVVTVTVTDPYGAESTAQTTVTVFNVAPEVAAFAGATLLPGETFAAAGSFGDPGADEWTATVDYGDGSGAQPLALAGKAFALSHVYAAAGTYTVTVTVTDDEGYAGTRTATVTVRTAQQGIANLSAQVSGLLVGGNANALNATLRAASASLDRGSAGSAANQMEAFVNQVEAQVSAGRLSQAQGDALIAEARRIIASIG
jgi:DNA/RNA endonuclease G (NUC1)